MATDPSPASPDPRDSGAAEFPESTSGDAVSDLAAAYAELQNLLLESPEITNFLGQVASLAVAVVPGNSSCGITLRRNGDVATIAFSDQFAVHVDELQYGRGQGPCLQALHSGQVVSVPDLSREDRWGEYRVHALAYGVRSSLSIPLFVENETRGALNLYSGETNCYSAADIERGAAFARQAATALTLVFRRTDQAVLEGQLREALASRALIDQALGILMAQRRLDAAQAFAILREASQARNIRLRAVAEDVIRTVTGKPPSPPRPFTNPG